MCSAPLSVIWFPPKASHTSWESLMTVRRARLRALTPSSPILLQPSCKSRDGGGRSGEGGVGGRSGEGGVGKEKWGGKSGSGIM